MLHTFVGEDDDAVKEKVRTPMTNYLRTYMDQYGSQGGASEVRREDVDTVLAMAFENYFHNQSLLGTVDKCARMVDRLRAIGVDEAACLIDFGAEPAEILDALPHLARLQERYAHLETAPRTLEATA